MPFMMFARPTDTSKGGGGYQGGGAGGQQAKSQNAISGGGGYWGSQGYGLTGPAAAGSGSIGGNISKTTPGSATGGTMPFGAGGGNAPQGFNPRGNGMVRGGGPGGMPRPGQAGPAQAGPSQPFTQPGAETKPAYGASMPGKGGAPAQSVYNKFATTFQSNPFRDRLRQRGAGLNLGGTPVTTSSQPGQQFTGQQGSQAQYDYFNNIMANGGTLDPFEMAQWAQLRNQFSQSTGGSGTGGAGAA